MRFAHRNNTGDGVDRRPDTKAAEAYFKTIKDLATKRPEKPLVFYLSDEAQEYRQFVSKTVEAVMALPDTSTAFKAHLNKWSGIFARLLLTYHLIGEPVKLEGSNWHINGETAARVARLMIDFLLPNAARFYSELFSQGEHLKHSQWIAGYILSRNLKKISARDIYRAYREFRTDSTGIDYEGIERTMWGLVAAGWVEPINKEKREKTTKWKVNPTVHSTFAPRAEMERQRREEEKQRIQEAIRFLKLSSEE